MKNMEPSITNIHILFYFTYFFLILLLTILRKKEIQYFKHISIHLSCKRFPNHPKVFDQIDEITFITVPFPVNNTKKFITMMYSFSSWLAISPKSHIILFTSKEYFDKTQHFTSKIEEIFGINRIAYAGPICSNMNGIPYIREWFIQGLKLVKSKYVSFINSDIVLPSNWLNITKNIFLHPKLLNKSLFLISQRLNFNLNETIFQSINFTKYKKNHQKLLHIFEKIALNDPNKRFSPPGAIDIFTFRADKPPFNPNVIPLFHMGKPAWDNWLVGYMNTISETVSFGNYSFVYHAGPMREKYNDGSPEYFINRNLYFKNIKFDGDNSKTKWVIKNGNLFRRNSSIKYQIIL